VRREGHGRATAVLWVVGVAEDGYREHLGLWTGNSESLESWSAVFQDLTERGLSGVTYAVSDEHGGLVQALRRYFPDAAHQRCQVHYLRNVLAHVSSDATRNLLTTALKDAWSAPTKAEAEARLTRLIGHVQKKLPQLATWLEETSHETLGVYALRPAHRRRLRTTNSIEHDHAEVRRRTRVVRIFPNEASVIRLTTALAIERNEQWLERCYLPMNEENAAGTELLRQTA